MSQLKVNAISDAAGANGNAITLATDGTCTAKVTSGITQGLSNRNILVNGKFHINQREAATTVNNGNNNYGIDQWYGRGEGSKAVFTVTQTAHGSLLAYGVRYCAKVAVTTNATTVSGDVYKIAQRIEGADCVRLALGTASAKSFTLSFLVRSSVTGTHSGSFMNSAQDRSYPFTYTISAADTWEAKEITIAGDTSGTWLVSNGIGLELNFDLGSDANKRAAAGSWHAQRAEGATGAVQLTETSNATWEITKVQLEEGSSGTDFEHRSFSEELARCERYFQVFGDAGGNTSFLMPFAVHSSTAGMGAPVFKCEMRSGPTLTATSCIGLTNGNGSAGNPDVVTDYVRKNSLRLKLTNMTNLAQGDVSILQGGYITLSAEL